MRKFGSLFFGLIIACGLFATVQANEPRPRVFSVTADLASIADGAGATQAVTIRDAALGDFCLASLSVDSVDLTIACTVISSTSAEIRVQNESGGAVDLASTTFRVLVFKNPRF